MLEGCIGLTGRFFNDFRVCHLFVTTHTRQQTQAGSLAQSQHSHVHVEGETSRRRSVAWSMRPDGSSSSQSTPFVDGEPAVLRATVGRERHSSRFTPTIVGDGIAGKAKHETASEQ